MVGGPLNMSVLKKKKKKKDHPRSYGCVPVSWKSQEIPARTPTGSP